MFLRPRLRLILLLAGGVVFAGAESRPVSGEGASRADPLRLGVVEFATSGHPDAQPHFLRGVAALHSFWYPEAFAAFQAALKIDPGFAMAWWGVAMSFNRPYLAGSNDEIARRALARIDAAAVMTPRERAYIEALRTYYAEEPASRTVAYAMAMEKLHLAYPEDLEAAAFFALSLLGYRWSSEEDLSRQERAGAVATEVFRRNPNHPGAAHYIIHSYDEPPLVSRGLDAARHYSRLAPDVPHALHMPSHIFLQLGMWSEVVTSNEAAWASSESWVRSRKLGPEFRDYHNLHWLIYGCLQQGRYARAAQLVDEFRAMRSGIPALALHYLDDSIAALVVETRRWDRAGGLLDPGPAAGVASNASPLKTAPGVELCGDDAPGTPVRGTAEFLRAFAASAQGVPEAGRLRDIVRARANGEDGLAKFWRVRLLVVSAMGHVQARAFTPAIELLREACRLDEELGRSPGPPSSFKPPHEFFGEVLLAAGRPADAAEQFEKALFRHPNRPLTLIGRARAAVATGNTLGARAAYGQLIRTWENADRDLPELLEAESYLRTNASR